MSSGLIVLLGINFFFVVAAALFLFAIAVGVDRG